MEQRDYKRAGYEGELLQKRKGLIPQNGTELTDSIKMSFFGGILLDRGHGFGHDLVQFFKLQKFFTQ